MSEYKYPQDLIDFITEQESEGAEIFITQGTDCTIWIVKPNGLNDWYQIMSWFEGDENYETVNISGKSVDRLLAVIGEERQRMEKYNLTQD